MKKGIVAALIICLSLALVGCDSKNVIQGTTTDINCLESQVVSFFVSTPQNENICCVVEDSTAIYLESQAMGSEDFAELLKSGSVKVEVQLGRQQRDTKDSSGNDAKAYTVKTVKIIEISGK